MATVIRLAVMAWATYGDGAGDDDDDDDHGGGCDDSGHGGNVDNACDDD